MDLNSPVKFAVKISLELDDDRSANFVDELETLLAKYAEPSHKYRLTILNNTMEKI